MHFYQRTPWFKEQVYQRLLVGNPEQQLYAASVLAEVGGEAQLLRGLQANEPKVHEMARRGLDHMWFFAAGNAAYAKLEAANEAAEEHRCHEALFILNRLIADHPHY